MPAPPEGGIGRKVMGKACPWDSCEMQSIRYQHGCTSTGAALDVAVKAPATKSGTELHKVEACLVSQWRSIILIWCFGSKLQNQAGSQPP